MKPITKAMKMQRKCNENEGTGRVMFESHFGAITTTSGLDRKWGKRSAFGRQGLWKRSAIGRRVDGVLVECTVLDESLRGSAQALA